eukprot:Opistho-2@57020
MSAMHPTLLASKARAQARMQQTASNFPMRQQQQQPKPAPAPLEEPVDYAAAGASVITVTEEQYASYTAKASRARPTGLILRDLINYMKANMQFMRFDEILTETGNSVITADQYRELLESLKQNPKVYYENDQFKFKPTINVSGKDDIVSLLRGMYEEGVGGMLQSTLLESYPEVGNDIDALVESKAILGMLRPFANDRALFYNDPDYAINVDPEVQKLWECMPVPTDTDLNAYFKKVGIQSIKTFSDTPLYEQKRKKQRTGRAPTRITNTHMIKHNAHPNA